VQGDPPAWAGHGDLLRSASQAAPRLIEAAPTTE
jgi:hypothetical protein